MKNEAIENAPLLPGNEPKCSSFQGNSTADVQHQTPATDAKNAENSAAPSGVLDSAPSSKLYIDASQVARLIGVPRSVIEDDVRRGMAGAIDTLTGAASRDICVVSAWDISEPERLAMHRARLTAIKTGVTP